MAGEITLDEMIEEVEREIRLREKVYPRWVSIKHPKLSETQAKIQMARMLAVRDTLVYLNQAGGPPSRSILGAPLGPGAMVQAALRQAENKPKPDPLSQALNEGDGVYRP